MANQVATISKKVSGGEELVVVRRKDFEEFKKWQDEVQEALAKVARGRGEYKDRKTIVANSPKKFR